MTERDMKHTYETTRGRRSRTSVASAAGYGTCRADDDGDLNYEWSDHPAYHITARDVQRHNAEVEAYENDMERISRLLSRDEVTEMFESAGINVGL